jgi:hypothetical protein
MATKTKSARRSALPDAKKADAELVQEAYEDAVKKQVDGFFGYCIVNDRKAEQRFLTGLDVIRKARDRAMQLVAR